MQKLNDLLKSLDIYNEAKAYQKDQTELNLYWDKIFQDISNEVQLKAFSDNHLKIKVFDSILRQELLYREKDILKRIKNCCTNVVVKSITIM